MKQIIYSIFYGMDRNRKKITRKINKTVLYSYIKGIFKQILDEKTHKLLTNREVYAKENAISY